MSFLPNEGSGTRNPGFGFGSSVENSVTRIVMVRGMPVPAFARPLAKSSGIFNAHYARDRYFAIMGMPLMPRTDVWIRGMPVGTCGHQISLKSNKE